MVKVTGKLTEEQIAALGDPRVIIEDLKRFRRSIEAYQRRHAELLAAYPDQWIALHDEELCAHAPSLDELLGELDRLGVARGDAFVKLLETSPPELIL